LFTRENPVFGQFIELNDFEGLDRSFFNETKPTKVIIHGLFNNSTSKINTILVPSYLNNFDVNVLVVGWGLGANTPCYGWAVERSYRVGKVVAEFLDFLLGYDQDKWDQLTMVGHSLGAHICGYAGKRVRRGKVGTIFGLDAGMQESLFLGSSKKRAVHKRRS
jgi:pancreatic triacylglycerol lipase